MLSDALIGDLGSTIPRRSFFWEAFNQVVLPVRQCRGTLLLLCLARSACRGDLSSGLVSY
jgi:hypothetical protein